MPGWDRRISQYNVMRKTFIRRLGRKIMPRNRNKCNCVHISLFNEILIYLFFFPPVIILAFFFFWSNQLSWLCIGPCLSIPSPSGVAKATREVGFFNHEEEILPKSCLQLQLNSVRITSGCLFLLFPKLLIFNTSLSLSP